MKHISCLSLLALILFFLSVAAPVQAQKQGIEVKPAIVDVELSSSSAEALVELTYTNHTKHPVILELFPIDFRQTNPYGAIGFLGQDATYSYSLSSFLSFETNYLDLDPGQKRVFTLKAMNRPDLSPGGHYAAVVARQIQQQRDTTTVNPAVSALIFLRKVGGERFNLSLKDISWPKGAFTFQYPGTITATFQNEGNTHLTPRGRMEVKDMFGRVLYEATVNESSLKVLPESRRYIAVYARRMDWSLPVSFNVMTITGEDSYKKTNYLRQESFIYIHPVVLLVLFVVLVGFSEYHRRKRRQRAQIEEKKELLRKKREQKKKELAKQKK